MRKQVNEPYEAIPEEIAFDFLLDTTFPLIPPSLFNREWYCAISSEDKIAVALTGFEEEIANGKYYFHSYFSGDDQPLVSLVGIPLEPEYTQLKLF